MIKKFVALFSIVLSLVILFGCFSPPKARFEPTKSFTATAQAKKGDFSFSCKITCASYEDVRLEFVSPPSLEGLSLVLSAEGIKVNAYGIVDSYPADYIGSSSPVSIILNAVRDGVFVAKEFEEAGDGNYYSDIAIGEIPVRVLYSEDGKIRRIDAFSENFCAELE